MFAVIDNSVVRVPGLPLPEGRGVPMIGGGFDGTYYGEKGNENIISGLGNGTPFTGLTYDTTTKVMKQMGAKKVAAVGYGASPSSTAVGQDHSRLRGAGAGPRGRVPQHHGRVRQHRRRARRARHQELGCRRPATCRSTPTSNFAIVQGLAAERREDEVQHPRHRLRPGPARPAHRQDASSPTTSCSSDVPAGRARRTRRPSSSRPT